MPYACVGRDAIFYVLKLLKSPAQNGEMAGYCWIHLLKMYLVPKSVPTTCCLPQLAADSERPFGITVRVEKKPWITETETALLNVICKLALRLSTVGPSFLTLELHLTLSLASASSLWYSQPVGLEFVCCLCFCGVVLSRWTEAWERLPNEVVMMAKETWT